MALGPFARRRSALAAPHEDLAGAGPKDQEREECRLGTAVVNGDVPPVWYRQRMAALAAEQVTAAPVEDAPPA
jgi:hypothetical protein